MTGAQQQQQRGPMNNEPQRFPIGESCDLLGIDRMTLKRWLDEARMEPQTDTIDKRYKYLTREQIVVLARRHNRIVRLEQQAPGPRLSRREREHQERLEAVEGVVRQLVENQAEMLRMLERLSSATSQPLPPLPAVPTLLTPEHPRVTSGWVSTSRNPLPPLPEGWVAFRAFARSLGVPETTAIRWVKRGKWPEPHRGQWASGPSGTYAITQAYDPDQQRIVHELMTRKDAGTPETFGDDAPS